MKQTCVARIVVVLLLGIGIGIGAPRGGTEQKAETARDAVVRLAARARQWQADAVLINLSTFDADPAGAARTWSSLFYSPSAKKWLAATATGSTLDVLEVRQGLTDPIGEFIDSGEAIQIARANGLEPGKETMMGLAWMGAADGLACWTVGGGFEPGAVAIVLNAKSGELITKHEMH